MNLIIDLGESPFAAKMMIETLCIAQSRISNSNLDKHRQASDIYRLQSLINQIEEQCDEVQN